MYKRTARTTIIGTLLAGMLAISSPRANATNCGAFPNALANGTTADASQVMANFNSIRDCANNNLAPIASPSFTGMVGIGMTPSYPLDVLLNQNGSGARIRITNNDSGNGALALVNISAHGANSALAVYGDGVANSGVIRGGGVKLSADGGGGLTLATDVSQPIYFATNNAEKMRLDASGNVGIGTNAPSYTLHVNGSVAGTSAYNNLSDIRLKKNVMPIIDALSTEEKLRGIRFTWRAPIERDVGKTLDLPTEAPQVGFVAQDVRAVLPEAVTIAEGEEAIMSMQESKIVPLLVEAIKELKASNEEAVSKLQHDIADLRRERRDEASNGNVLHRVALAFGWR